MHIYARSLRLRRSSSSLCTNALMFLSQMDTVREVSSAAAGSGEMAAFRGGIDGRPKILSIIGPTGSGKSQLAIDIAKSFGNCEIINCDVIQMYKGLDIASAKVPLAEREGIPHHLFSFLGPKQVYTVRNFRKMASFAIDDVVSRHKLPIIVGGTMYYAQSLMRDSLLEAHDVPTADDAADTAAKSDGYSITNINTAATMPVESTIKHTIGLYSYERLAAVDPVMAERLHPHDNRKIQRALEVFDTTGRPYSAVIRDQAVKLPERASAFNNLVIWLQVRDQNVHNARLDQRVFKMLKAGLLDEVRQLKKVLDDETAVAISTDEPSELTKTAATICGEAPHAVESDAAEDNSYQGLLQAIGYKEFADYLTQVEAHAVSPDAQVALENSVITQIFNEDGSRQDVSTKRAKRSDDNSAVPPEVREALCGSIHSLLDVTHRYAKVQDRFIRNRFVKRKLQLHALDTSDLHVWRSGVMEPTELLVQKWLSGALPGCDAELTFHETDKDGIPTASDAHSIFVWKKFHCESCDRILNGEKEWEDHQRSRSHRNSLRFHHMRQKLAEERGIHIAPKRPRPSSASTPAPV